MIKDQSTGGVIVFPVKQVLAWSLKLPGKVL